MDLIAGGSLALLAALIEGAEAAAVLTGGFARSRRRGLGLLSVAVAVAVLGWSFQAGLAPLVPASWREPAGTAVVLAAGVQWTLRSARRLMGAVPPHDPVTAARTGSAAGPGPARRAVAAGAAEVLVISSGLGWAGSQPVLPLAAAAAWCLIAGTRLARPFSPQAERLVKMIFAAALTGAAAGQGAAAALLTAAVLAAEVLLAARYRAAGDHGPSATGIRGFLLGDDALAWAVVGVWAIAYGTGRALTAPLVALALGALLLRTTRSASRRGVPADDHCDAGKLGRKYTDRPVRQGHDGSHGVTTRENRARAAHQFREVLSAEPAQRLPRDRFTVGHQRNPLRPPVHRV